MENYCNEPHYGKQVTLIEPYKGYCRGTIVGRDGYRYIIQFSSGLEMSYYEDEFYFD